MHLSGSRGLQVMWVELGDHLMLPLKGDNDKGYWEDIVKWQRLAVRHF
jgi:hypothetical protein